MQKIIAYCRESGSFWMILASLSFAAMGVFVKLGSVHFSTAELVFYRCAAGLIFIALMILPQGKTLKVSYLAFKMHLSRSLAGFIALMLYFYAISQLTLSMAVTLNYTSPLFFVLITMIRQKQWPHWQLLGSIALGFIGVVSLLQPTMAAEQWLGGLMGLLSGLLASVAYMNVSELGKIGEPEWRTVFYFSLISTLGAGFFMLLQAEPLLRPSVHDGLIIFGMGSCATLAQLAMTRAYRKGRSLVMVSLSYLTVLFSTLLSWMVWGDAPTSLALVAMLMIVLAGIGARSSRNS
ncbi:DMT family transporter [Deefgea salmonis]|uniref:DMT family transporter n=1 Tax=Deefgea salmonis TaxID=2875502 RepID=A0ABS8BH23_9NEIS|nr:DMT family transporter [Deefgea salmonis]MCB5195015.1 DMT family transporter [Deefgea salmonis]